MTIEVGNLLSFYTGKVRAALDSVDLEEVKAIFFQLLRIRNEKGNLFLAGNGGSAATSQHFAVDLSVGGINRNSTMRAICLSDNQGIVTATANDKSFESIFCSQLSIWGESKDALLVISASGNSPNLILAARKAKSLGMTTLGLLGFDGGELRSLCDASVLVATEQGEYGIVEDVHLSICHNLTEALRKIDL